MDTLYTIYNGAAPTTAALVAVTTGTSLKTMLQLAPPSGCQLRIAAWGISFDGTPVGVKCELVELDVAATVTAHAASGIVSFNDPASTSGSRLTLGTAATGYTASAQNTPTASRLLDNEFLSTNTYVREWPLGHEPVVQPGKFLAIRVTSGAAVNCYCWTMHKEG